MSEIQNSSRWTCIYKWYNTLQYRCRCYSSLHDCDYAVFGTWFQDNLNKMNVSNKSRAVWNDLVKRQSTEQRSWVAVIHLSHLLGVNKQNRITPTHSQVGQRRIVFDPPLAVVFLHRSNYVTMLGKSNLMYYV